MSKKTKELENLIIKHKELYYAGNAIITDEEYDLLEDELRKISPNSEVLNLVGSTKKIGKKIKHAKKMLSLQKTYIKEDLESWIEGKEAISTFKYDGSSCSLIYENGKLTIGKTRGNGSEGENITDKTLLITNIPKSISDKGNIEIRGEIICDEESFFSLTKEMVQLGLDKPQSQRNIVAGLLGRKENIELVKHLKFFAFEYLKDKRDFKTEIEKFKKLEKLGFDTPEVTIHKNGLDSSALEAAQDFIENGNYLIDGLVFSYNDLLLHDNLGETAHHPRYKIAFKFQGEAKNTKIISIDWGVSRNGILTPVANVEPVELSGAMIGKVTLHNYGLVESFNLKSGDEIKIIRSGEVIPKFLEVIKSSKKQFQIPENCPSCEEKLKIQDIRLLCTNPFCPAQGKQRILHYLKVMGVEDLSDKRLDQMWEKNVVKDIKDIYKLTIDTLLTLDKTKDKLANKIIQNISGTKEADLVTFLASFGISGTGKNTNHKIVDAGYNTLEKILSISIENLKDVESFAEKSGTDFKQDLMVLSPLIKEIGKIVKPKFNEVVKNNTLNGKSFCITGTLSMKRGDLQNMVKENGGKVASAVSKNLDYLITNDKASSSSKFKKAQELNIPIITEQDFFNLLNQ